MKLFSTLFMTFCSLVLLAGCSPLIVVDALSPEDGYRVESGLSFGPEARQALDVYRPLQARPGAPVVVFFYGGSWRRGERGNYRFVGQSLAARGYTVAIPDYRLYPEVAFPTFVEDGARAVAWVARSLPEAKNGIMLIGHSAGAHIAALLTLDRSYLAAWDLSADDLAGMIGLAGPYAFDPSRSPRFKPIFAAAQPPDSSQPLKHARGDAPPLLLLHGADDGIVRTKDSKLLQQRIAGLGGEARYVEYPGVGHIEIVIALSASLDHLAPVMSDVEAFLQAH